MIFVTGGTGLLGSHLLFELTKSDEPIKAIYRDKTKIETVKKVFYFYSPSTAESQFNKITWVFCDILDVTSLREEMTDCNHVYHCAALVSFHKKDYYRLMKINREGTANVINAALENQIKKLCYVSSTAAIGGHEPIITEDSKWKQSPSTSGYSISKYSAEKEVWRGAEEGLNVVIVNPCMIIGAGDWDESSMTIFKTVDKGLKFYTPGSNAFVDARDVSEIMVLLMKSQISNERFLCIGENTTFKNLLTLIANNLSKKTPSYKVSLTTMKIAYFFISIVSRILNKKPIITKETINSSCSNTQYDASKIEKELNFIFINLETSIQNAVNGRIL